MDLKILLLCIGVFLTGIIIGTLVKPRKSIGNLVVDRSDLDGPYLFVELNRVTPEDISKERSVTFRVINKNYISH